MRLFLLLSLLTLTATSLTSAAPETPRIATFSAVDAVT